MTLKQLYKRVISQNMRNRIAGLPWMDRWRQRQLLAEGRRLAATDKAARKPDGKICVTFIVQRPALWPNHASIYEAMVADPAFETSVLAIPKRPPAASEVDLNEFQRLKIFLQDKGIPFRSGYDCENHFWHNPLSFGLPDLVFLPQPYTFTQSWLWHGGYLKNFCDLAILNYGVTIADMPYMQYDLPIYGDCRFIFVESEAHKALFTARRPDLENRLFVTGHPKLDFYGKKTTADLNLLKCPRAKHRIIWAPHFTVTNDRTPHTFANFFEYYDFFVNMACKYSDIEFILRPHPDLFEHMIAVGLKTRSEADAYRDRFNSLPNGQVYEGGDIFPLFALSSALILDSIGFLAEYAPTGKPICFLDSKRRQRLNPIGEKLLQTYYIAWNKEDIEGFVHGVVIKGCDPRREERLAAVHHYLFMPQQGAGDLISQTVKNHYNDIFKRLKRRI